MIREQRDTANTPAKVPTVGIADLRMCFGLVCVLAMHVISGCVPSPDPQIRYHIGSGVPVVRVLLARPQADATVATLNGAYYLKADGRLFMRGEDAFSCTVRRTGGVWRLAGRQISANTIELESPGGVVLGGKAYRGKLVMTADGPQRFSVVNHVDLESYLAGVLPKELFPRWHLEAYRAQAIAARSFAMYHMLSTGANRTHDLGDTVASQVYGGMSAETDKAWRAVSSTQGMVLVAGQDGENRVFMAQYSSACGGHTNPAGVLRNVPDVAPLHTSRPCGYCSFSSKYRWPTVRVSKAEIFSKLCRNDNRFASLGALETIRTISQLSHGRPVWVDVVGTTGAALRVRAETIRLALIFGGSQAAKRLYSMNCEIVDAGAYIEFRNGRGYGHGVGLCQHGAEGMARAGKTGEEIMGFFYARATIVRAY